MIPEAANNSFTFHVHPKVDDTVGDYYSPGEVYHLTNYNRKGYIPIGSSKDDTFFSEYFFLDVICNANCMCTVEK